MNEQQLSDLSMLRVKLTNAKDSAEAAVDRAQRAFTYIADCQKLAERIAQFQAPDTGQPKGSSKDTASEPGSAAAPIVSRPIFHTAE